MIVKRKMEVGADEFFDYLEFVLLKEIKRSVDKKITKSKVVEGLEFTRNVEINNQKHVTKCKLEVLQKPTDYCLMIDTGKSIQRIIHHIDIIDDNHIIDHYEERIEAKDWKVKVQTFLEKDNMKSKMKDTLKNFEKQVINRRR